MWPLRFEVDQTFRPAYNAARISLVFWSSALVALIIYASVPGTSSHDARGAIFHTVVAVLAIAIDIPFLGFIYRSKYHQPIIGSGWLAVIVFGILFVSFGLLGAGLDQVDNPPEWLPFLVFMSLLGIFLRDGLIHSSYKKWEVAFEAPNANDTEMQRLHPERPSPRIFNFDMSHSVFNHIGRDQFNMTVNHGEPD